MSEAAELAVAPVIATRYRYPESFCLMQYVCRLKKKDELDQEEVKTIRVWNSRDGYAPSQYTQDSLTYRHEDWKNDVCKPDWMPELGSLVITDADSKGTPKFQVVNMPWLEKFKRLHGNPDATIKRLDNQVKLLTADNAHLKAALDASRAESQTRWDGNCELAAQLNTARRTEAENLKAIGDMSDLVQNMQNERAQERDELKRLRAMEQHVIAFETVIRATLI